jgi:OmcA/MtrC family decaheme c-type cytochrome
VVPPPPDEEVPDFGSAVAPGLNIEIQEIVIPADLRPEVAFTATDDAGNIIPLDEFADARFILAYLDAPSGDPTPSFFSYTTSIEDPDKVPGSGDEATRAGYDSASLNGLTQQADGSLLYKFAAALPADFDTALTHQLGGQLERLSVVDGLEYIANPVETFRPDGGAVTEVRDIIDLESCNTCHTRLQLHGARREIGLCILCHTPQSTDANSGNTVNFPEMIHKIHRGADLPSVEAGEPYQIIGYRNTVHDYSDVEFPQDIRNCTACHSEVSEKVGSDVWQEEPTLEGCASCHDRTWFDDPAQTPEGFTDHLGGQQVNSSLCAQCHTPTAPGVSPIHEAHLLPTETVDAPGLSFEITEVATAEGVEGTLVTITFAVADKDGNPYVTLDSLSSVASTLAWPASEYETTLREVIRGTSGPVGTLVNLGGGLYTYTFAGEVPQDAEFTFGVAMEGRLSFTHEGSTFTQGTANNALTYFTIDGSDPEVPESIVSTEKCNECHDDIRAHGSQRVGADYCIMCHNVNATDAARRPEDELPPVTIAFKELIHRIHTGENLDMEYTVFGFGGTAHDFTEVRFSGLRQECSICHLPNTFSLPLPETVLPTVVEQDGELVSMEYATSAACTSCHDSLVTNVHGMLATDLELGIETCAVCHGPDSDFAVEQVHQLNP